MPLTARPQIPRRLPGGFGGRIGPFVGNTTVYGALRGPLRTTATRVGSSYRVIRPHVTAILGTPVAAPIGVAHTLLRPGRVAPAHPHTTSILGPPPAQVAPVGVVRAQLRPWTFPHTRTLTQAILGPQMRPLDESSILMMRHPRRWRYR